MQRLTYRALAYYQFDALCQANVNHGVFTRLGGISVGQWASLNMSCSTGDAVEQVRENCRRALEALNLKPTQSLTSGMEHGNHVRVVSRDDLRAESKNNVRADALVTRERGLALRLSFADCIPILLFDPMKGAIGIVHAGWRGIVRGVLMATAHVMQREFGSRPQDIIAGVGPCIGPDKFEVGEDVAAQIQAAVRERVVIRDASVRDREDRGTGEQGDFHPFTLPTGCLRIGDRKARVNLWAAARSQLQDAGVGRIEVAGICTASHTHEWFSHRAERGKTGRFGAVIALD